VRPLEIVRHLFIFDAQRYALNRGMLLAAAAAMLATLLAVLISHPYDLAEFRAQGLANDGHMLLSLEEAFNKSFCGMDASFYFKPPLLSMREGLLGNPEILSQPLREVVASRFGTLQAYCASPMQPYMNNENALYFGYSALLSLWPNATLDNLATAVTTARIVILFFVAFAMIYLGMGAVWAFLAAFFGLEQHLRIAATSILSIYPFMTIQLAALIASLALCYGWGQRQGWSLTRHAVIGTITGFALFWIWNMRTSQGMIAIVALFVIAILLYLRGEPFAAGRARWQAVGVLVMSCLLTSLAMQRIAFRNITDTGYNHSYHPISHPLVLGLAIPDNALARREGLAWDDAVGLGIARRVDPTATYLGPTYERALFSYYFGLWRKYPSEMIGIYMSKFQIATRGMLREGMEPGSLAYRMLAPMDALVSYGWLWLFTQVILGLAAAYLFIRRDGPHWLGLALFGTIGALLLVEEAAILSTYDPIHFGSLLYWTILSIVIVGQMILNGMNRLLHAAIGKESSK
jgi:hypothetical protein